jgi:hypothetical protein
MIVAFPIVIWFAWKKLSVQKGRILVVITTVTLIATIVVGLAVGHMFPRYLTRVYGPMIVTCLLSWEAINTTAMTPAKHRWAAISASVFVIATLVQNVWRLPMYIFAPHSY